MCVLHIWRLHIWILGQRPGKDSCVCVLFMLDLRAWWRRLQRTGNKRDLPTIDVHLQGMIIILGVLNVRL